MGDRVRPYREYDIFGNKHLLFNCDFMEVAKTLPDKSQHLIIADPPYFEVKGDFDFIWNSFEDYLKDVEKWAIELKRILADNGTLFWWGHAKKIAYSQVILDKYFNLINSAVWEKNECQTLKNEIKALRSFAPVTERVLIYDKGENKSGNDRIFDDNSLFIPLKKYFDDWLDVSGLTLKEAVAKIGSSSNHWFGFTKREKSQFSIPTKIKWDIMGDLYPHSKEYEDLRLEYEDLRLEYEDLRLEYEDLRRVFNLPCMISDVFKYSQESHITKKYDHKTKKPLGLTRMLIKTCSRKGQNMFIPFGGSGTETEVGINEGLKVIVCEMEEKHCITIDKRIEAETQQLTLF